MEESKSEEVAEFLHQLQDEICDAARALDDTYELREDSWERPEGGGGRTRAMEGGKVFEKGGVNFSDVRGDSLPASATARKPELAGAPFRAMGVSVVIHPGNPFAPTSHFNVRYFEAETDKGRQWWFGGGFDLTPYYGFEEDVIHWHETAREACVPYGEDLYPKLKKWCDEYFFLKHRNEPRGVGGIFFDDFNEGGFENAFGFVLPEGLLPDRGASLGDTGRDASQGVSAISTRTLRGVQPGLRPRHLVRVAIEGADGIHPHVASTGSVLAIQLAPGTG